MAPFQRIWLPRILVVVFLGIFAVLVFGRAMERSLNHDEHQFLVPGALLSRSGLLPYRDYPLFHLPNLVFIYSALDTLSGRILASAKLFSALCTMLTGGIIAWACCRNAGDRRLPMALGAASLLTLLFFNPIFDFTIGKTWNHEFPTLGLIAALLLNAGNQTRARIWMAVCAGLCAGTATGARLTFVTVAAPLCGAPLLYQLPWRQRLTLTGACAGGFLVAMLPTFWLWAAAPEHFWFDNFQFPRLRLLDAEDDRVKKTMSFWRKVRFLFKEVLLPSLPLVIAYAVAGIAPAVHWFRKRTPSLLPSALVLLSIPLMIAGCFSPSRYQLQHYYVLVPVLALGTALGLRVQRQRKVRLLVPAVGVLAIAGIVCALMERDFTWMRSITQPNEWFASRFSENARALRREVPSGRVLTLGPTMAIEAGLEIYPAFATGPFAWRAAGLIQPPERRTRLGFAAAEDLESYLSGIPPAAILTGFEEEPVEAPLVAYAVVHHYRRVELSRKFVAWVRQ
jgi:hypothetical protein